MNHIMVGLFSLLSMTADGRWQPSIGDPTAMGWLTVAAYVVAAGVCLRAAQEGALSAHEQPAADPRAAAQLGFVGERLRIARFFRALFVLLVLLGINKQLDLQTLFTQLARDLALAQGWYGDRRRYQVVFIAVVGVLGTLGTVGLAFALRKIAARIWLALLGFGFLVSFVLIRAASFHHVDLLLRSGPVRLNWIFELAGIALIAFAAHRNGERTTAATRPSERAAKAQTEQG